MSTGTTPVLCLSDGCRRLHGHTGQHDKYPVEAWAFFAEKDKQKLVKAGFATPRGGAKGAYQNHVGRSSKVIIPYERLSFVDLTLYRDGYVVRLLPEQFFESPGCPRAEFLGDASTLRVGDNAFVLYRTHESLRRYPPPQEWELRSLTRDGQATDTRRGSVVDGGHFVLRLSRLGANPKRYDGPPQGIFATEYADGDTNYLCKCVLAWLIVQTSASPYTVVQAAHLRAVLERESLYDALHYEKRGALRHGLSCCPLCLRILKYPELHDTIAFEDVSGLGNASEQVEGATRSTVVNLFHIEPLVYHSLVHVPQNIAWGHAVCNTRLGQRKCFSLDELIGMNLKVGILRDEGIETFGWISNDWQMIRSPNGAVWIQLNGDIEEGPPEESTVFDEAVEEPTPIE